MVAARRARDIPLVAALVVGLMGCALPRGLEAARVLGDIAAVDGPSDLKAATPAPSRTPVAYQIAGRAHDGDLYRPGEAARAAIVLVPGVAEAGKDDRRLVAFAKTLARARFLVLVPDVGALRALKVRAGDAREIADAVAYLAVARGPENQGPIGIAAISYAVGPALIAALEPDLRERLDFFVGIGGYHDIEAVVTFFTTGYYRDAPGGAWRHRAPNDYGKWVFVKSNLDLLRDAADRAALGEMARRKLIRRDADVGDLTARLGAEGRAVLALLENTDPARVAGLIAGLPDGIRAEIAALDLAARDLGALGARLILVHGVEDDIIPASESRALAAAAGGRADLFLVDGFGHVGAEPGAFGKFALWRAVYRLLELRDGAGAA